MKNRRNLNDNVLTYFKRPRVFDELNLVTSGEIKLHWANWDLLLEKMKEESLSSENSYTACEIAQKIEEYDKVPVWIINKQGNIETSLKELYTYFLDPRLRELWFEINEDTLLSFKSGSGPFIRLQSMRWFDFDVYKTFIFQNLLEKENSVMRSFRLSVDIPLTCSFLDSIQSDVSANIVQLSQQGLLLKIEGSDIQKFDCSQEVIFSANLSPFKSAKNKEFALLDEIFTKNIFNKKVKGTSFRLKKNILSIRNNKNNMVYSNGNEYYLFVHFDDLNESDKKKVQAPLLSVVKKFEDFAIEHLEEVA